MGSQQLRTTAHHEFVDYQQHVYFLQGEVNDASGLLIKIGCSGWPVTRIRQLRTNHKKVELLAMVPGGKMEEAICHSVFDGNRYSGEWFYPSNRLMDFVQFCRESGTLPSQIAEVANLKGLI